MATKIASMFTKLQSLLILFLHLGCFFISKTNHYNPKKRKLPPISHFKRHPKKAISSSFSFLKRIFSSSSSYKTSTHTISSRSSHQSLASLVPPEPTLLSNEQTTISSTLFPLRNDIFPCPSCGEIFQAPHLLEHHQTTCHAVSELQEGDAGRNIVHMIFKSGWSGKNKTPFIQRVLKIHNSQRILTRFEEYREFVKSKASKNGGVLFRRDERCMADGNELLRFFCSTFVCNLGVNGGSCLCNYQYCSVCGIVRFGFSPKLDGISMFSTSYGAHVAVPDDMEEEFKFMNVKRAILVCRVIAGRVSSDDDTTKVVVDSEFDSVLVRRGSGGGGAHTGLDEEELLLFNPMAVLPCFVIVYTV